MCPVGISQLWKASRQRVFYITVTTRQSSLLGKRGGGGSAEESLRVTVGWSQGRPVSK